MTRKKIYNVTLSSDERNHLKNLVSAGSDKARKLTRARILLKADENWLDKEISAALNVGQATVERIRKKYVEDGLDVALNRQPSRRVYARKLDGADEARLTTLACGSAPEGRVRWTLRLLADRFVKLERVEVESISYETVRQILKKTTLNHGKTNNG